jgi:hypothetical protein
LLNWNSRAGLVYRVQTNTSGSSTNWVDLSGRITAAGLTTSWTDTEVVSNTQRLYRVVKIQ